MTGVTVAVVLALAAAWTWSKAGMPPAPRGFGLGRRLDDLLTASREILSRLGRRRRRSHVAELCHGLAAELRAGATPESALLAAAADHPACPRAVHAARLNADVAGALRADAEEARSDALSGLAACWEVAAHTGAGLARGADRVAEVSRSEERLRGELAQELAAPRATARLLALLPLSGLALGQLLGADPFRFLTGTATGRTCLAVGALLSATGWAWSRQVTRSALPDLRVDSRRRRR